MNHPSRYRRAPRTFLTISTVIGLLGTAACDDLKRTKPVASSEVLDHIEGQLGSVPTSIDTTMTAALSTAFRAAAAKAMPAVVQITVTQRTLRTEGGFRFQGM